MAGIIAEQDATGQVKDICNYNRTTLRHTAEPVQGNGSAGCRPAQ